MAIATATKRSLKRAPRVRRAHRRASARNSAAYDTLDLAFAVVELALDSGEALSALRLRTLMSALYSMWQVRRTGVELFDSNNLQDKASDFNRFCSAFRGRGIVSLEEAGFYADLLDIEPGDSGALAPEDLEWLRAAVGRCLGLSISRLRLIGAGLLTGREGA